MKIKQNISLSSLSTFGIGGKVKHFIEVKKVRDLIDAVSWAKNNNIKHKICGDSSNIVFPDKNLDILLIKIGNKKINRINEDTIEVSAGTKLMELVNFANKNGLEGLETLAGIPGTVGGAIVGNAGAYGRSISEAVYKVSVFDGEKDNWITSKECNFAYRESKFKRSNLILIKAQLKLLKGDKEKLQKKSKEIVEIRNKKYKPELKCPGSFFKNVLVKNVTKNTLKLIPKDKVIEGKIPAGYLLEQVGARGVKQGDIAIADFHGNLFINEGGGTAKDVKELASILKERVKEKYGIELEEEVRYF